MPKKWKELTVMGVRTTYRRTYSNYRKASLLIIFLLLIRI